jgi:hypothetical protein
MDGWLGFHGQNVPKSTGKPHISWENHGNIMEFPVSIFPTKLNPLIEEISVISIGGNFMGNW